MTITCKTFSKFTMAAVVSAVSALPAISLAMESGVDAAAPLAFSEPSSAAAVALYSTAADFSYVAGGSARISIVEKTNVPSGSVPVPASVALLLVGAAALRAAKKRK